MKSKIIKPVGFLFFEIALFILAYTGGIYKHILFSQILQDISKLSAPPQLISFLMIVVMSLPVMLIMYFINRFFLKISVKLFLMQHGIFIFLVWSLLELLIYIF